MLVMTRANQIKWMSGASRIHLKGIGILSEVIRRSERLENLANKVVANMIQTEDKAGWQENPIWRIFVGHTMSRQEIRSTWIKYSEKCKFNVIYLGLFMESVSRSTFLIFIGLPLTFLGTVRRLATFGVTPMCCAPDFPESQKATGSNCKKSSAQLWIRTK